MVLFSRSEVATLMEWGPSDGEEIPDGSWFPLAWKRSADVITWAVPDSRRAATLVVQGAYGGKVSWAFDGGIVVLNSAAEELLGLLAQDAFWQGPILRLRRVGDDRRDLDKAMRGAKRSEERKAKDATQVGP